jgi:hypothetical protein
VAQHSTRVNGTDAYWRLPARPVALTARSLIRERRRELLLMALVVAHGPLALIFRSRPMLLVPLGLAVLGLGLLSALHSRGRGFLLLCCAAYMIGFEQIYRAIQMGVDDILHWEFAKYSVTLILGLSVLLRGEKMARLPLLYIIMLVPSTVLAVLFGMEGLALIEARRMVTFNLSGPVCLGVCAIYFAGKQLTPAQLRTMIIILLAPIVTVAVLGPLNLAENADQVVFTRNANRLAAGGGGPNQVSNTLGIGATLCWLMLLQSNIRMRTRLFLGAVFFGLMIPMFLTFSRGGVFSCLATVTATIPLAMQGRGQRLRSIVLVAVTLLLLWGVIWPFITTYTSGAAAIRYSSLQTDRWGLAFAELKVWADHPVFGVGTGLARFEVKRYVGHVFGAHVEYTRLLAEHGVFGLMALVLFFAGFFKCFRKARTVEWRVWIVGTMVFVCAYWAQAATRTAGQGFMYGLVWLTIVSPQLANGLRQSAGPLLHRNRTAPVSRRPHPG